MTTRQVNRRDRTMRRAVPAVFVAVIAAVLAVAGPPSPASAAVPKAAQSWSSLMFHSLTPSAAYTQLRQKLATQRSTLSTLGTTLVKGRATQATAQSALTAAITTDANARTRAALAAEALTTARHTLTVVSQKRPVSGAAVTGAKGTVTTATAAATTARTEARAAAAALKSALSTASTATTVLDRTTTAWQRTSAAIRTNQQRLIALDKSDELARQAAALSRDVVAQVRAGFTLADTTTVNGITVHKSVAFAFRRMLADAQADGVVLSGGGFRTRQRQIELRKINGCPDVWTAPASSCRVPTAIPGRSLHELGLAVDITAGGSSLTAGSAGFRWLAANAARYGYVNLPSEPWHWSITGG